MREKGDKKRLDTLDVTNVLPLNWWFLYPTHGDAGRVARGLLRSPVAEWWVR